MMINFSFQYLTHNVYPQSVLDEPVVLIELLFAPFTREKIINFLCEKLVRGKIKKRP